MSDFQLLDEGTIVLLRPVTPAAHTWVEENIGRENGYQPYWPTIVIEHRYVENIVTGIRDDGLEVQ